jgi:ribonuclease J
VQITVYDGADTIGGNKILLEDGGVNLLFDFGINFNLGNRYFEEYLVPRSRRGLLDMFHTGLLPAIRGI